MRPVEEGIGGVLTAHEASSTFLKNRGLFWQRFGTSPGSSLRVSGFVQGFDLEVQFGHLSVCGLSEYRKVCVLQLTILWES